jgi:dienelactone hydrolase
MLITSPGGAIYTGEDYYDEQANRAIADRLEGKLLLIHGEADENLPVAATLSLADALVAADKDFDLVIVPNRPHACGADPPVMPARPNGWPAAVRPGRAKSPGKMGRSVRNGLFSMRWGLRSLHGGA